MSHTAYSDTASDINLLAHFLANSQIQELSNHESPIDCIIICASAILYQAETLFEMLSQSPDLTKTVILCGGIGHSTKLLWDAVAKKPKYHSLAASIKGKPEARVLEELMLRYFPNCSEPRQWKLLIEDQSTNCGANALNSRAVLEVSWVPTPKTCVVIQDPTMARRTIASFEKAFGGLKNPPRFLSCTFFVPEMRFVGPTMRYMVPAVPSDDLWEFDRFMELILGEIPRLRDDGEGYGPHGKGFITHVDIPVEVEDAWKRLMKVFGKRR
jgi:hypothetical protein